MNECKHDFEKELLHTNNVDVRLRRIQSVTLKGKVSDHGYGIMIDHKDKLIAYAFTFCPLCGERLIPEEAVNHA